MKSLLRYSWVKQKVLIFNRTTNSPQDVWYNRVNCTLICSGVIFTWVFFCRFKFGFIWILCSQLLTSKIQRFIFDFSAFCLVSTCNQDGKMFASQLPPSFKGIMPVNAVLEVKYIFPRYVAAVLTLANWTTVEKPLSLSWSCTHFPRGGYFESINDQKYKGALITFLILCCKYLGCKSSQVDCTAPFSRSNIQLCGAFVIYRSHHMTINLGACGKQWCLNKLLVSPHWI